MLEVIDGLIDALGRLPLWGLAGAVAVVMILESSLLTGVVVPGDLVVLFAASTVRTPGQYAVLLAAVTTGSVVGETVGYTIGRRVGHRLQRGRIGRLIGADRWSKAADYLERRGMRAVFAGRFLAALHAILPIVAGSVRMNCRRFLTACVAGALTWAALYLTIGVAAGASYRAVAERLNVVSGVIVGGLIGAAMFLAVALIRRGIVRLSRNLVDAGIALAVAAVVSFGITIAQEAEARSPDALAFALGIASSLTLLGHRRWPVQVLAATVVASFTYYLLDYPAGSIDIRCAWRSTAPQPAVV
jgi:membrane-associated protein